MRLSASKLNANHAYVLKSDARIPTPEVRDLQSEVWRPLSLAKLSPGVLSKRYFGNANRTTF
jgi:hypothetical protein